MNYFWRLLSALLFGAIAVLLSRYCDMFSVDYWVILFLVFAFGVSELVYGLTSKET